MGKFISSHNDGLNPNKSIVIEALDNPGSCQSNIYSVTYKNGGTDQGDYRSQSIKFQSGDPNTFGINGLTNEALLAIIEDRLIGFNNGQYACRENALALTYIQQAMMWLQKRAKDRQ